MKLDTKVRHQDINQTNLHKQYNSGVGVGGVLLQHGHPVTFISQALTETEVLLKY